MATAVEFASGSGRCSAWSFPAREPATTCVVMANGFSLTKHDGLVAYAEAFSEAGADVLAFDYRHFGDSPGMPRQRLRIAEQREDWRSAVRYARQEHQHVVTWGFSLGGGLALLHAATDGAVDAVIAVNPLADGMHRARTTPLSLLVRLMPAVVADLAGRTTNVPVAGPPGARAAMNRPGEADGFAAVVGPGSPWRNEVSAGVLVQTPWVRPHRHAERLKCPVWLCLSERDDSVSPRAIEQIAARAPHAQLRRYPHGHFGPLALEVAAAVAAHQVDFLRGAGLLSPKLRT